MTGAAELAAACPTVTFILQHAGMLEDLSDRGRERWHAAMALLARQPNVVSKLSGFGTFLHANDAGHIERLISDTVALFGAERCLFGSNFPIEKLWTHYGSLVDAHVAGSAALGDAVQAQLFLDTAARVYRL